MTKLIVIIVIIYILEASNTCSAKRSYRLLNGTDAQPGEFPYAVSLSRNGIHVCGGALISRKHVLTTAHCFVGRADPPYTRNLVIVVGSIFRSKGEYHRVKRVSLHNNYQHGTRARWANDIAVIEMSDSIIENENQAPVLLPSNDTGTNITAILCGWGQTSSTSLESERLMKMQVNVLSNDECNKKGSQLLDTHLCGFNGRNTGFCNGDSGSPLVYNNVLIGLVSFSVACGINYPDTYTRVFSHLDFVNSKLRNFY